MGRRYFAECYYFCEKVKNVATRDFCYDKKKCRLFGLTDIILDGFATLLVLGLRSVISFW